MAFNALNSPAPMNMPDFEDASPAHFQPEGGGQNPPAIFSALQNANFEFPARKVTVNLAPADLPKESGRFDLPIALGILAAGG